MSHTPEQNRKKHEAQRESIRHHRHASVDRMNENRNQKDVFHGQDPSAYEADMEQGQ